ncbi:MAG: hypothetical protein JWQ09_719, partial [Segetibacter sp.]|nr:hypothetical protein [Segetibacter sp.]
TFFSPTKNFSAGAYGSETNNATVSYGNYSVPLVNTTFSFEATTINDSLITGTFSFIVSSPSSGLATKITEGQIKAGIGERNRC